ncbi:Pvc16 family protein [uncultured Tateyamaria sp.]|uniref:Pvc16 family protein n=1 Tax=uncultured Tateyamaria sp. TaxID=455651 RepID=UPI0026170DC4|nr:Pvc16 family protein [uncultured Tateyamaria sp.]
MSNVLAISAVTQLMKDLINDAMINGNISQVLGSDFTVTALPPNRVVSENSADQATQLNLFLYRVSPNAALRNSDMPTRNRAGDLVCRPRLALDLHYILTAVSAEELHAEILLGYAMQLFHEQAMLPREVIREALNLAIIDQILPPEDFDPIRASELADQVEMIKITPRTLSMDDMSKLWTAFQASYRTTVAYDVSVVLIERELPVRPSLPVLSRGGLVDPETERDPGVTVRPDLANTVPTLTAVTPEDGHPVMRLGGNVVLEGFALDGAEVTVRFTEPGTGVVLPMPPLEPAAPNRLVVTLPDGVPLLPGSPQAGGVFDPARWRVGAYVVDVSVWDAEGREMVSNALPLALAPLSTAAAAAVLGNVELTLTCAPPIRPGQTVAIAAGASAIPVDTPVTPVNEASATFAGLTSGVEVPVRLRVDGIDSPVIDLTTEPPSLETVTIP